MSDNDHRAIVREGYDRAAASYLADRPRESPDVRALDQLLRWLPPGSLVLDAGCGAGVPIMATLAETCSVVGVDFSAEQLALAKRYVPQAALACQDLTALAVAPGAFDAVCSYYAIIHIPRKYHAGVIAALYRALKPGGLAFLCLGAEDLDNDLDGNFYGVDMYWSHFDAETNLKLIRDAGFEAIWAEVIGDSLGGEAAIGGHLFILARKPEQRAP